MAVRAGDSFPVQIENESLPGFNLRVAQAAALSNVSSSASNQKLLDANPDRQGLFIVNESTAVLYIKYGATASLTSYTVPIGAGGYWEMPEPIWLGQIDGLWGAANGAARITELT